MESVLERNNIRARWVGDFPIVNEEQIRNFAKSIGDMNPLHHDNDAARKAGLQGIIAPGVMIIGFVSSTIAKTIPGVQVCRLEMEFVSPLYTGSLPTVLCLVLNKNRKFAKISVIIKNRLELVAKGSCLLSLPRV